MMRRVSMIIMLSLGISVCQAQHLSRSQIDSLLHPAVMNNASQIVRFDSCSLRLPAMVETDTTRHSVTFRLTNVSAEPLVISRAVATCGCTKVTHRPTAPIAAGKRDSIVVQYIPRRDAGTIDEPIYVYSSRDDKHPVAALHVLGTVEASPDAQWSYLPQTMGTLRLKRKELRFGTSDTVMRIPCANTGPAPITLRSSLLPPYATFHTEPQTIKPGEEADIVVRIDRSKMPSVRPLKAAIILEGIPCDITSRQIKLIIQ